MIEDTRPAVKNKACMKFTESIAKHSAGTVSKTIFSIKVYVTLLDYLKFLRSPS
jgi:hypothetical protein